MKRRLVVASVLLAGFGLSVPSLAAPPAQKSNPAAAPEAPTVTSLAVLSDGFRWGVNHTEVTKAHNKVNGIIDREYNPILLKVQPGVRMQALEAERDTKKYNFANSFLEFKDTPVGYDTTGLKGEYSYKNRETMQVRTTDTKRRFFFYVGAPPSERLWKIYDEVKLAEGGPYGKTYQEAVLKMNAQLSVAGKARNADPDRGLFLPYTEWQDGTSHLRLVDRSSEGIVGVTLADKNTYKNIASLRPNTLDDPMAMDPSIALVTKGGVSDPNATKPAAENESAPAGGKAPAKKKK